MKPRLVLFDIDGTLLSLRGAGRASLDQAFLDCFGREGSCNGVRFHGRTDPEIVQEVLGRLGAGKNACHRLIGRYLHHLSGRLRDRPPEVLPGVREVLEALSSRTCVTLGIVTGNVRRGAGLKLQAGGLDGFHVGAYGDEAATRTELLVLARRRAEERAGIPYAPGTVFYVGDTASDVQAARDGGAVSLAVATGGEPRAALEASGPAYLFDSLDPTGGFLDVVLAD